MQQKKNHRYFSYRKYNKWMGGMERDLYGGISRKVEYIMFISIKKEGERNEDRPHEV